MSVAIKIENVSKLYRLGMVGTGTIAHDLNRWWHTIRGKEDPYAKVGQVNDRTKKSGKSSVASRQSSANATAENCQLPTANSAAGGPANCQLPTDDSREAGPEYVWALRDINLEVQQGEILGIIGRNGAGKSTLLKLLSRVTAPTTGSIKTKGRIASLLEVGTGFHPDLTGRENIYMNGAILGMRRHEITQQLDEIVEFSGCAKYLDTPVKRYSSGMTVRLGFAVAAHLPCEIMIVDEVLAVGDAEFQKRCLNRMQSVADFGKTVLFVSHNLASIRTLTTRAIVLSRGQVIFDGPSEEGIVEYVKENVFVQATSQTIQTLARPFPGLDRILEFRDLKLFANNGSLDSNALFAFDAEIHAQADASDFRLGMTVYSEDKTPIGSAFSEAIESPKKGKSQSIRFQAYFSLAPGRYHCAVSLSRAASEGKYLHDSLSDVLPFEVSAPPTDVRGWHSSWGYIRLPQLDQANVQESSH